MENIEDKFQYSKLDVIGHGAFAIVYKGRRMNNHQPVAIKCVTKKKLMKSEALLSKEIKILKELTQLQHKNVVALYYCTDIGSHVYLVMEYCNGGDLSDYLGSNNHKLPEQTIRIFLKQLAKAMKALVNKDIVHRDLKPQNILLSHDPKILKPTASDITLKIADFGFARFLKGEDMAVTLCGSPMYMAPEVIMSLPYGCQADLWSLGTILYQCLAGQAPFTAQSPQQLKNYYEVHKELKPAYPSGTSPEMWSLLTGLLRRDASDRMSFDEFFRHPLIGLHSMPSSTPRPIPEQTKPMGSPSMRYQSLSPAESSLPRYRTSSPKTSNINTHGSPGLRNDQGQTMQAISVEDGFVMVSAMKQGEPNLASASPKNPSGLVCIQSLELIAQPTPETELLRASVGEYMELGGIPVPGQEEAYKAMIQEATDLEKKQISAEKKKEFSMPKPMKIQLPTVQFQRLTEVEERRASLSNANVPEPSTDAKTDNVQRSKNVPVLDRENANSENINRVSPYSPRRVSKRLESPDFTAGSPIKHAHYVETDHKKNFAKLMFVKRFVDCILIVVEAKSNIRLFDDDVRRASRNNSEDQGPKNNSGKRLMDQLVLYHKAMEILGSSIHMAVDELYSDRLQESKQVLDVLKYMREMWYYCQEQAEDIGKQFAPSDYPKYETESAEELLYDYAKRLCQNASFDEICLMEDIKETARRYEMAQVLLHCLVQECTDERDKRLLIKYKSAVERRLHILSNKGVVLAVRSDEI